MNDIEIKAIDPERLKAMRDAGQDEFGNPWTLRIAEGWEPLRCCLRKPSEGEQIALICYSPWTSPSPWAESGPVFVHYGECAGYNGERYPDYVGRGECMVNPFDADGARVYDHITFIHAEDDHEEIVRKLALLPEVDFLHVRSATAGCFTFEVRAARDSS
jgi:hypothetical protein